MPNNVIMLNIVFIIFIISMLTILDAFSGGQLGIL
jgi:hypothetical protein